MAKPVSPCGTGAGTPLGVHGGAVIFKPASRVVKGDADRFPFDLHRIIKRTGAGDVLSIRDLACNLGEAITDVVFVPRMNVGTVTMSMATAMPVAGSASVLRCASRRTAQPPSDGNFCGARWLANCHEEEGKVALFPFLAPVGDHPRKERLVLNAIADVRLA